VPKTIVIPAGENNEGLTAQEYRYNVISVAQDSQGKPSAILGLKFKSRLIPLFQFAAFYDQDMDTSLPPNMTLSGPVHSNNDLYLNAFGNLKIKGQVTTANKLYRGLKNEDKCSGNVNIDDAKPAPRNFGSAPCSGGRTEFNAAAVAPWKGKIRVGVQTLKPPPPDDFDATENKLYWKSADLRLVLDLDSNSIQIRNNDNSSDSGFSAQLNGSLCAPPTTLAAAANIGDTSLTVASSPPNLKQGDIITLGSDPLSKLGSTGNSYVVANTYTLSATTIPLTQPLTAPFTAGAELRKPVVSFSDKTFRNYREKRGGATGVDAYTKIQMLNVDMRGLLGCAKVLMGNKTLDEDSEGGLVWFFTVKGPDSTKSANDYGIRVYNGQDLVTPVDPVAKETPKGLTIVSDQAVYMRGDYNCGSACTAASFEAPANDGQRIPAAVMADTINVLSNNWSLDDLTSINNIYLAGRTTTETTINAAFLAGIDITGGVNRGGKDLNDNTGGGLNNYPRFHEDWTGTPFNYLGSLVSLSAPKRVNGIFCGSGGTNPSCNIYNPPTRNWSYDLRFNNAANLPPLTPRVLSLKQELFSRNFDQASVPSFSPWAVLSPQRLFRLLGALIQSHS
jgi:hypothetical protein